VISLFTLTSFYILINYTMEEVTITLEWEEYKTMLAAISAMKNMVDSEKLDALYVKLSTKYKGV